MYFPSRGGVRGGQDQFNWEDIKTDKFRENYLGHSVKAPVGRWQKGKDLTWYARDKNNDEARRACIAKLKVAEAEAISAALGHKQIKRDHCQLTKEEMTEALKRGQIERSSLDVDRIEGFGYSGARASKAGPREGMSFYMPAIPTEKKKNDVDKKPAEDEKSAEQIKVSEDQSSKKSKHSSKKKSSKRKKKSKKQKSKHQSESSSNEGEATNSDEESTEVISQPIRNEKSIENQTKRDKDNRHRIAEDTRKRSQQRKSKYEHSHSRDRRTRYDYADKEFPSLERKQSKNRDFPDSETENQKSRRVQTRRKRRDSSNESSSDSRRKPKRERTISRKRYDSSSD